MLSISRHKAPDIAATGSLALAQQTNGIRNGSVPLEGGVYAVSGILRFKGLEEMKDFVVALHEVYKEEYERTSDAIGSMFRDGVEASFRGSATGSWEKMGALFVEITSAERGGMEVAMQLLNDLKPKLTKTEEVIDAFRLLQEVHASSRSAFLLYIRNGVPERVIVDSREPAAGRFSLCEEYELT